MTVTFIAHSAYLVEWDKFYTLFDYTYEPDYTGALPELNPDRPAARQHPAHRRRGRGFEHPRHQVDGHRQCLSSAR